MACRTIKSNCGNYSINVALKTESSVVYTYALIYGFGNLIYELTKPEPGFPYCFINSNGTNIFVYNNNDNCILLDLKTLEIITIELEGLIPNKFDYCPKLKKLLVIGESRDSTCEELKVFDLSNLREIEIVNDKIKAPNGGHFWSEEGLMLKRIITKTIEGRLVSSLPLDEQFNLLPEDVYDEEVIECLI